MNLVTCKRRIIIGYDNLRFLGTYSLLRDQSYLRKLDQSFLIKFLDLSGPTIIEYAKSYVDNLMQKMKIQGHQRLL